MRVARGDGERAELRDELAEQEGMPCVSVRPIRRWRADRWRGQGHRVEVRRGGVVQRDALRLAELPQDRAAKLRGRRLLERRGQQHRRCSGTPARGRSARPCAAARPAGSPSATRAASGWAGAPPVRRARRQRGGLLAPRARGAAVRGARGRVLRELGDGGTRLAGRRAAAHLAGCRRTDPRARADIGLRLGIAHYYAGRHAAAVDALLAAIEATAAAPQLREDRLRLEAFLAVAGRYDLDTEHRVRGRIHALAAGLAGATAGERLVRAVAASESAGPTAHDLHRATADAERAFGELPRPDPGEGVGTVAMYLHAGRPDAAAALVERLLASTRAEGSPLRHALAIACRGVVALDVGDLTAARSDLEAALETWADLGDEMLSAPMAGYAAQALAWSGRTDAGEAVLDRYGVCGEIPGQMLFNPLLFCRGTVRMAQGRFEDAERDFRELGRRHDQWGMTRPSPPWRSATALALVARGRLDEARPLAAEELEIARAWDTPKAIAFATRALALAEPGPGALPGLAEAVARLDGTPWRLDRARARLDLGAALRRAGRRRDARAALALAMDEAHAAGAEPLAERAAAELRASGARPRRRAISGIEALTPSERRVAALAAEGRTNREIAQELFVTLATVETHLTRTYRKLDVAGRDGLAARLAEG